MTAHETFVLLRDLLAKLYSSESDARRIISDAGLDERRINFGASAIVFWHAILQEAEKTDKLRALMAVVLSEYGTNPELQRVLSAYQQSHVAPEIDRISLPSVRPRRRIGLVLGVVTIAMLLVFAVVYMLPSGQSKVPRYERQATDGQTPVTSAEPNSTAVPVLTALPAQSGSITVIASSPSLTSATEILPAPPTVPFTVAPNTATASVSDIGSQRNVLTETDLAGVTATLTIQPSPTVASIVTPTFTPTTSVPTDGTFGAVVKAATIASPGEVDTYTFQGHKGDHALIAVADTGPNVSFVLDVELIDPDGELIAHNTENTVVHLNTVLDKDGQYKVVVRESDTTTGSYSLTLDNIAPGHGTSIAYGAVVTDTIEHEGDFDVYTFMGKHDDLMMLVAADLSPNVSFNIVMELYYPNGVLLDRDVENTVVTMSETLIQDGPYTIIVREPDNTIGDYRLFLENIAPPSQNHMAIGDSVEGILEPGGDFDVFTFDGKAGTELSLTATDKGPNVAFIISVELIDPTGAVVVAKTDNRLIQFTQQLTIDGPYTIIVKELDTTVGEYILAIEDTDTNTVDLSGNLDLNSQDTPLLTEIPMVNVGNQFMIDKYETTNAEYQECVDAGVCTVPAQVSFGTRIRYFGSSEYANYPVIFINWTQATEYCAFRNKRLPTVDEWMYAATGCAANDSACLPQQIYPWGTTNPTCEHANFYRGGYYCFDGPAPVGRYNDEIDREQGASPFGAIDMAGNVWEWTIGCLDGATCHLPVIKGGDWGSALYKNINMRDVANVAADTTGEGGVRCVRDTR